MKQVAVVTDSVACVPSDLTTRYGIHVIPVRITVGGKVYRDTCDDLPPLLVRSFQETPMIDTTPWPPEHYFRAYEEVSRTAREIVHIVAFSQFTSTISLARAGAVMAQEAVPGLRVVVFDSASTTMAQGFIALEAARTAARGRGIADVVLAAERIRHRVDGVFAFDTLRHLARTGRVNRLASWAGSLLNVMPVVGLSQGRERPLALTRSRLQATRKMLDMVCRGVEPKQPVHVAVVESGRRDEAEELLLTIQERLHPVESMAVRVSPVTQVVAGPGLLGVVFYADD